MKRASHLLLAMLCAGPLLKGQTGLNDLNFQAQSEFQPTIKDAIKLSDLPEIRDTVKRLTNIRYGITSKPVFSKYEVQPIAAARMPNEKLNRLYHVLLKAGYAPLYNMPYGELWAGSTRNREGSWAAHFRHLSGTGALKDVGYSGFAQNAADISGKKFYKKHTLTGDLGYSNNALHYYGYNDSLKPDVKSTRQRYQVIEPRIVLQSHYTDSTHVNHRVGLGFYHLDNIQKEHENNIRLDALGSFFVQKEQLNVGLLTDYYNHQLSHDTLNDLIVTLSPSFEAHGKQWHATIGVSGTLDDFDNVSRFHFYPNLKIDYDVYEGILIPYAGVDGRLIKNSVRRLVNENPFIGPSPRLTNTNNKMNLYGGLRGNLSSNTAYDARVSYGVYDSLNYYVINYADSTRLANTFNVVYDNTTLLKVTGELQHKVSERFHLLATGNYYMYSPQYLERAYLKPAFDITGSFIYNMQNKFLLRADLFTRGSQFARVPVVADSTRFRSQYIPGWTDLNLEGEYRYSKMLSFFARFNNILNQRYYRWDRYPSQRFNFMIGLTFVPF